MLLLLLLHHHRVPWLLKLINHLLDLLSLLLLLVVLLILLLLLFTHQELIGVDGRDVVGEVGLAQPAVSTQVAEGDPGKRGELGNDQFTLECAIVQTIQGVPDHFLEPEQNVLRSEE